MCQYYFPFPLSSLCAAQNFPKCEESLLLSFECPVGHRPGYKGPKAITTS
jgi:hypothetical protein